LGWDARPAAIGKVLCRPDQQPINWVFSCKPEAHRAKVSPHVTIGTPSTPQNERVTFFFVLAGLALTAALALRLASVALNPTLSSDVLYPHLFAYDILTGSYPSSGWSFGGATFFFPDYLLYLPLLATLGADGVSFAAYAVVWFLVLAALIASVARWWFGCRPAISWLAGALTANVMLALQFLPQHIIVLWWFSLPGYHGGTLINGLALVAITGRMLSKPSSNCAMWVAAGLTLWLGITANILLLIQFFVPLLGAVWWLGRCGAAPPDLARKLGLLGLLALVAMLLTKAGLDLANWGYYLRLKPLHKLTFWTILRDAMKFYRDVAINLSPHVWGWFGALLLWLGLLTMDLRRRNRSDRPAETQRALAFHLMAGLSICIMADVLIVSGWWINWNNGRYLLNALLLPLVAVAIAAARGPLATWLTGRPRLVGPVVVMLVASAGAIAGKTDQTGWRFQPTPEARAYGTFVKEHGLRHGLAGYWQANYLNTLAGSASEHRLGALLPDGKPYFWCNNAFWYFSPPTANGTLLWESYDHIILEGLDRAIILEHFGTPAEITRIGSWEMFIYDLAGQERIRTSLEPQVVEKLGPSRLRGLRPMPQIFSE
jgi:hypothetical protein